MEDQLKVPTASKGLRSHWCSLAPHNDLRPAAKKLRQPCNKLYPCSIYIQIDTKKWYIYIYLKKTVIYLFSLDIKWYKPPRLQNRKITSCQKSGMNYEYPVNQLWIMTVLFFGGPDRYDIHTELTEAFGQILVSIHLLRRSYMIWHHRGLMTMIHARALSKLISISGNRQMSTWRAASTDIMVR